MENLKNHPCYNKEVMNLNRKFITSLLYCFTCDLNPQLIQLTYLNPFDP